VDKRCGAPRQRWWTALRLPPYSADQQGWQVDERGPRSMR